MTTIYKYVLEFMGKRQIELPIDAQILSVQLQNEQLCLWAKVNTTLPTVKRVIHIYGTGHHIEEDNLSYIGTVQDGGFVWHIFIK